MTATARIIAAIDNSAAARPVVAMALALAPVFGAGVEAVHVAEEDGGTARGCAAAMGVPFATLEGDAFDALARLVDDDSVVAMVVGARSRPNGRPAGHLARALASAVEKPIVVVPPQSQPPDAVHSVLLAIEGSPRKALALKQAVTLAADANVQLTVVHVDDDSSIPSFSDQVQHETEIYTKEFLSRHVIGAPEARLELRVGNPADEILDVADSVAPEMIAIGWPHTADTDRGLVAKAVLDRSRLPVLLVATE